MLSVHMDAVERHGDSLTDTITIDFESIPNYVLSTLTACTVARVKEFMRQPGGREYLEARAQAKTDENIEDNTADGPEPRGHFKAFSEWAQENGYGVQQSAISQGSKKNDRQGRGVK